MNDKALALVSKLEDCTIFSEKNFLKRVANNFDTSIPLLIYDVTDETAVIEKIYEHFDGDVKKEEDYILVTPKTLYEKKRFSFGDLQEIIWRLRDPDGCPWDRAQTIKSIRKNIIEEAYELTEAIDLESIPKMREECGDVVLQGVFTAVMCEESGLFSVNDTISELCEKLITRHTHIFGKDKAKNAEEALQFWEKAKAKEKHYTEISDRIASIPETYNALMRATKVQKIIKKTGFDHPTIKDATEKLYEEINELLEAKDDSIEKEAGDVLFSAVNVVRLFDIDPEIALLGTVNRFIKRFDYIVKKANEHGKKVEELSLSEMEIYYNEAKKVGL